MSTIKRHNQRDTNFTQCEEQTLMRLIMAHIRVLDDNYGNFLTNKLKKKAWISVVQQFAIKTGVKRSYNTLRVKYRSLKIKLIKKNAINDSSSTRAPSIVRRPSCDEAECNESISLNSIKVEAFDMFELEEPCLQINATVSKSQVAAESQKQNPQKVFNKTTRIRTLAKETNELLKMQQKFYRNENIRALEIVNVRRELFELKKELLDVKSKLRTEADIKIEEYD